MSEFCKRRPACAFRPQHVLFHCNLARYGSRGTDRKAHFRPLWQGPGDSLIKPSVVQSRMGNAGRCQSRFCRFMLGRQHDWAFGGLWPRGVSDETRPCGFVRVLAHQQSDVICGTGFSRPCTPSAPSWPVSPVTRIWPAIFGGTSRFLGCAQKYPSSSPKRAARGIKRFTAEQYKLKPCRLSGKRIPDGRHIQAESQGPGRAGFKPNKCQGRDEIAIRTVFATKLASIECRPAETGAFGADVAPCWAARRNSTEPPGKLIFDLGLVARFGGLG